MILRMGLNVSAVRHLPSKCALAKTHAVPNEARERGSKPYTKMEEIDGNAQHQQGAHALAEFDASKTVLRAREAVRHDGSPAMLKALEQAEAGWERGMNKIAERAGQVQGPTIRRARTLHGACP